MVDFEFKIIGVEKGTHSLNSDNGGEWNVEDLPDVPHELAEAIANDYRETLTGFVKWLRSNPTDWHLIGQPELLASAYMNGH